MLYVFGVEAMDVGVCVAAFRQLFSSTVDHILVLYHTSYSHCISEYDVHHCISIYNIVCLLQVVWRML